MPASRISDASTSNPEGPLPKRLGRYEVIRRLAVGGMAEIYLARASGVQGMARVVVIKRILPRLWNSYEIVSMFIDEARIAATLRHANIVQVHDISDAEGEHFFAMEFLNGEDVASVMQALSERDRNLPLEHALGIVRDLCSGLHYAHEKVGMDGKALNIVHRDVSPSNIFVTSDGQVKLVDFGVARAAHRLSLTTGGLPKGKLGYMSPEQIKGGTLDRRSDIFSLAVVLWELTTSRRLLRGKTDYEVMSAITQEDAPPPSVFVDGYPSDLEEIVMKGLARDRTRRYQTAQELQLALEQLIREQRLAVSNIGLARLMKELFDTRPTAHLAVPGEAQRATAATSPGGEAEEDDVTPRPEDGVVPDFMRAVVDTAPNRVRPEPEPAGSGPTPRPAGVIAAAAPAAATATPVPPGSGPHGLPGAEARPPAPGAPPPPTVPPPMPPSGPHSLAGAKVQPPPGGHAAGGSAPHGLASATLQPPGGHAAPQGGSAPHPLGSAPRHPATASDPRLASSPGVASHPSLLAMAAAPRRRGRGLKITLAIIDVVLLGLVAGGAWVLHEYEIDPDAFATEPAASSVKRPPRARVRPAPAPRRSGAKRARPPARRRAEPKRSGQ